MVLYGGWFDEQVPLILGAMIFLAESIDAAARRIVERIDAYRAELRGEFDPVRHLR